MNIRPQIIVLIGLLTLLFPPNAYSKEVTEKFLKKIGKKIIFINENEIFQFDENGITKTGEVSFDDKPKLFRGKAISKTGLISGIARYKDKEYMKIVDINGNERFSLLMDQKSRYKHCFSNSGRYLLLSSIGSHPSLLFDLDTGKKRVLHDVKGISTWTIDDKGILFTKDLKQERIHLYEVETGKIELLFVGDSFHTYNPQKLNDIGEDESSGIVAMHCVGPDSVIIADHIKIMRINLETGEIEPLFYRYDLLKASWILFFRDIPDEVYAISSDGKYAIMKYYVIFVDICLGSYHRTHIIIDLEKGKYYEVPFKDIHGSIAIFSTE